MELHLAEWVGSADSAAGPLTLQVARVGHPTQTACGSTPTNSKCPWQILANGRSRPSLATPLRIRGANTCAQLRAFKNQESATRISRNRQRRFPVRLWTRDPLVKVGFLSTSRRCARSTKAACVPNGA